MDLDAQIVFNYLMNDCSKEEYAIINDWLAKDKNNQQWLFELEALWKERNPSDYAEPVYLRKQFEKTLEKINLQSCKQQKRSLFPNYQKYAAALAFLLVAGSTLFLIKDTLLDTFQPKQAYRIEQVNPQGDVREIILPDQSKVWLNSGSTLRYAEDFNTKERRVILTGEAYFQVTHDSTKPFRVQTELFTVKVLGTSFDVLAKSNSSQATLVEGKVVIEDKDEREILVLSPGQKVETIGEAGRLHVRAVNPELHTAWINGFIAFENATIQDISQKLEDLYGRKMLLDPSVNLEKTYTGSVLKEKEVEQVLKSLQNTIPFHFTDNGKTIMIQNKHK